MLKSITENDPDFSDGEWIPYSNIIDWELDDSTTGDKTIYLMFRDADGNVSGVYTSTITLTSATSTSDQLPSTGQNIILLWFLGMGILASLSIRQINVSKRF